MQAACGIEENQVIAVFLGKINAVFGNCNRIALAFVIDRDIQLLADHL